MCLCNKWVLLLAILTTSQLVRTDHCPGSPPCTCYKTYIYCDKDITVVPPMTGAAGTSYSLYLYNNPNLVITDDSFKNIALHYLSLDNDLDISISDHAFENQGKTLKSLSIVNCTLNKLPKALEDLDELETLKISKNKIKKWNVKAIKSLKKLDISNNELTNWDENLKDMISLESLNIKGNTFQVIPDDAFNNFKLQLNYLNMEDTGITEMITALPTLKNLTELRIGGKTLNDYSFTETWLRSKTGKSQVNTVFISNTRITRIPVGLSGNSLITSFDISGSQIKRVHEHVLPVNLTSLTIGDSLLTRVDGAICSKNLMSLDLRNNCIEFIEKHDLHDCVKVKNLYLSDNKISYISSTAFDRLTLLDTLELRKTKLKHIPVTMKTLKSIGFLYLQENSLECTCQDEWFPDWRRGLKQYYTLKGKCMQQGTSIFLDDFEPLQKPGTDNGRCEEPVPYPETNEDSNVCTKCTPCEYSSSAVLINPITITNSLPLFIILILQSM